LLEVSSGQRNQHHQMAWRRAVKTIALWGLVLAMLSGAFSTVALADSEGLEDLDEAMRVKINATGIRDINQAVELLQRALDKGLEPVDADFAQEMLSSALMERASALVRVINARSIADPKVRQVRQLVISDLRRILAYDNPPSRASFELGRLMAMPGGDPHEARRVLTANGQKLLFFVPVSRPTKPRPWPTSTKRSDWHPTTQDTDSSAPSSCGAEANLRTPSKKWARYSSRPPMMPMP